MYYVSIFENVYECNYYKCYLIPIMNIYIYATSKQNKIINDLISIQFYWYSALKNRHYKMYKFRI